MRSGRKNRVFLLVALFLLSLLNAISLPLPVESQISNEIAQEGVPIVQRKGNFILTWIMISQMPYVFNISIQNLQPTKAEVQLENIFSNTVFDGFKVDGFYEYTRITSDVDVADLGNVTRYESIPFSKIVSILALNNSWVGKVQIGNPKGPYFANLTTIDYYFPNGTYFANGTYQSTIVGYSIQNYSASTVNFYWWGIETVGYHKEPVSYLGWKDCKMQFFERTANTWTSGMGRITIPKFGSKPSEGTYNGTKWFRLEFSPPMANLENERWGSTGRVAISLNGTVFDPWWSSSWKYRKSHVIKGTTAGAQTNYQIPIRTRRSGVEIDSDGMIHAVGNTPAAIHYVGTYDRTYYVYMNTSGMLLIKYYDHTSQIWSNASLVKDWGSNWGDTGGTLCINSDGTLLVGYQTGDYLAIVCKKSTNPEDISSFGSEITINAAPNQVLHFLKETGGTVWGIYTSGGSSYTKLAYKKSTDGGSTWGSQVIVADFGSGRKIFPLAVMGSDNSVHLGWNPSDPLSNIYYMYTSDGGTTWKKRDGTTITLPATAATADLVYNSGSSNDMIFDVGLDSSNNPYIVFSDNYEKQTAYLRWAKYSGGWISYNVTTVRGWSTTYRQTGGHFDLTNVYSLYVEKIDTASPYNTNVEVWESSNQGVSWSKTLNITRNSDHINMRLQVVRNYASSGPKILWCEEDFWSAENVWLYHLLTYPATKDPNGLAVYVGTHTRNDFGDVRFTNATNSLLNYFLYDLDDYNYATFYTKIPSIPAFPTDVTIYIYYGNDAASNGGNGDNTFVFFDDFNRYNIGDIPNATKWTRIGVTPTNTITVQADPQNSGKKCFKILETGDGTSTSLQTISVLLFGYTMRYRVRIDTDAAYYIWGDNSTSHLTFFKRDPTVDRWQWSSGTYQEWTPQLPGYLNKWYEIDDLTFDTNKKSLRWIVEPMDLGSNIANYKRFFIGGFAATPKNGIDRYGFGTAYSPAMNYYIGGQGTNNRYIVQTKYAYPEPNQRSWGVEEFGNTAPTITQFGISAGIILSDQYFDFYVTLTDIDGASDIDHSTLTIGSVWLCWHQPSNIFIELSDPLNLCILDADNCKSILQSANSYQLRYRLKLSRVYGERYVSPSGSVYDKAGAVGQHTESNMFFFDVTEEEQTGFSGTTTTPPTTTPTTTPTLTEVKFLNDVPAFIGVDFQTYGPYEAGEVAWLPKDNAQTLINGGLAEYVTQPETQTLAQQIAQSFGSFSSDFSKTFMPGGVGAGFVAPSPEVLRPFIVRHGAEIIIWLVIFMVLIGLLREEKKKKEKPLDLDKLMSLKINFSSVSGKKKSNRIKWILIILIVITLLLFTPLGEYVKATLGGLLA